MFCSPLRNDRSTNLCLRPSHIYTFLINAPGRSGVSFSWAPERIADLHLAPTHTSIYSASGSRKHSWAEMFDGSWKGSMPPFRRLPRTTWPSSALPEVVGGGCIPKYALQIQLPIKNPYSWGEDRYWP